MNLLEQGEPPKPREEIRLESVSPASYSDGRRVKVSIEVTPFGPDDRPNLHINILNNNRDSVASMNVVEALDRLLVFTVHLRGDEVPHGHYEVEVQLFFDPAHIQDSITESFTLPPEGLH